jgi:hypothetical protein
MSPRYSDAERAEARALFAAKAARDAKRAAILGELFDRQQDVAKAWLGGLRFIALCCSRRAGKTQLLARMIALALLASGRNEWVVFTARTLQIARNIVWAELVALNERHQFGWKMLEHEGSISTASGAQFRLVGIDDKAAIEKVRGNKYRLVILDEASTYQEHLKRLINDAFRPGLGDLGGTLVLSGTPGYVCAGYWHEAATGKLHYRTWHWTLRENPFFPDPEAELAAVLAENKWTEDEPTYRREYLGLWINDGDSLVFGGYDPLRNKREAPAFNPARWIVTMGLDYGTQKDPSAIVVLGTPKGDDATYVLYARKHHKLLPDELSAEVRSVVERFKPDRAVGDSGGLGAPYVEEWNRRHAVDAGISVLPASKSDKLASTELVNGAFRSSKLFITPDAVELEGEVLYLPWFDTNRTKSHPAYEDHCSDAARYAFKEHTGYVWVTKPEPEQPPHEKWSTVDQRKERNRKKQRANEWWE